MAGELDALAGMGPPPSMGAGSALPTSASLSPDMGMEGEAPEAEEDAELGEIAMAFKEAANPADAASLLLEFLSAAGYRRDAGE